MPAYEGRSVRLGARPDFVQASFDAAAHVDALVRMLEPDDLPWVLRFALIQSMVSSWGRTGRHGAGPPSAGTAERLIRRSAATVLGYRPTIACFSDVMFVGATRNQALALAPIVRSMSESDHLRHSPTRARPSYSEFLQRLPEVRRLVAAVADEAALADALAPQEVWRHGVLAASDLAAYSRLVDAVSPRTVVVANQHFRPNRALLRVARNRGVRTIYIPHAPVAANAAYFDLPVDLALLRGPLELCHYRENGIRSLRARSVGTPSLPDELAPTEPSARRGTCHPPVFAPSPLPEGALRELLDLVTSSTDDFIVSLHPAMGRSAEALFKQRGCHVYRKGTTVDLLREGTPVLLQSSSGVGLEALATGTPVVDLAFPGSAPNYPYIRAPYVTQVTDTQTLRRELERAVETSTQTRHRTDLVSWAERWTGPHGDEATQTAVEAIHDFASSPSDGLEPVFDATQSTAP